MKSGSEFNLRIVRFPLGRALAALILVAALASIAQAQPAFVQRNSATPQTTSQTTVTVPYGAAQTAGNLNVVVVAWSHATAQIQSVVDTKGNVYIRALGPTSGTVSVPLAQSIYYSLLQQGAAAGANSVTVTFTAGVAYPDVRIAEYRGVDVNTPLDVGAGALGNSGMSNSGNLTTTAANDLLVAGNYVETSTSGAGTGFTSRIITSPDGDILEDRIAATSGTYSATAPLRSAGGWIMQVVAFRAAGGTPVPDLTITKTHTGNFTQGQVGANYTLTVRNAGTATTNGTVTVTDTLPTGLTATAFAGTGWSCTVTPLSCNRSDALAAGSSYPAIALTVNVAGNAGTPLTNSASVSGGGDTTSGNNTATDATTVNPPAVPDLAIAKTHNGNFTQGQTGATYTLTVTNRGTAATSGTVTVTDTLPMGMTATALVGTGWTCTLASMSCTRSGALATGASYPAITVTVNVASNAGSPVINSATVTGGGDTSNGNNTANDSTTINPMAADLTVSKTHTGSFTQGQTAATYVLTVTNAGTGPTDGTTVTLSDTLPAGLTAVSLTGNGWTCRLTPLGCTRSDVLAAGASYPAVTLTVSVDSNAPSTVTNVATVTGGGDANAANNNASDLTSVVGVTTTPIFVQSNFATPQTAVTSVSVPFTAAQTINNLNVIIVAWSGAALVQAVADSRGNPYNLAVGPTNGINGLNQSIYYSILLHGANAGANTVTITFTAAANFPDVRIAEYTGIDSVTPVDATAVGSGTTAASSTASVATLAANDLIVAGNYVETATVAAGTGYTKRVITTPDGDILEDRIAAMPGSYNASAPLSAAGSWVMQMVAFRAAASGTPQPDLTITKTHLGTFAPGQIDAIYTVTITNRGTASTSGTVTVTDTLPTGLTAVSLAGTGWTCTLSPLSCSRSDVLAVNISYPAITLTVNVATTASGSLTNVATVGGGGDNTPTNNTASDVTMITSAFSVTPRVTVITSAQTAQFSATTSVTWAVDGLVGGTASSGTITTTGLYSPPPTAGTHAVTATATDQTTVSATVYVSNYAGTFMHHNDNGRTGQNVQETVLTPANVNSTTFGKLFEYALDGMALASPLYVANVTIPGQGSHNVVYIATEHDSVYAFDADGQSATPLWKASFINPPSVTAVPCHDADPDCDIGPEIGITGTPVIDQTTGTLYVVAKTKESGQYVQRLHALDIGSGGEKLGGPVVIQASVPGTGGGSVGGQLALDPLRQNQRTALLLNNGVVYIGFGSHSDQQPYHGWLLGYNATTLQRVMVFCSTPNSQSGGIWQANGGAAVDAANSIFIVTGDGPFDANTGGNTYGDTYLKLSTAAAVLDYFTPHDQVNLSSGNFDLGAAGPLLLPDQPGAHPHLLVSAGKNRTMFLLDRDNLGHYNANNDNAAVQTLPNIFPTVPGNYSAPVYYNGRVYFGPVGDNIQAFTLTNGLLSTTPTSRSSLVYEYPGATLAASGNGSTNGILWGVQRIGNCGPPLCSTSAPGVLHAYDARDLTIELYDSTQAGSRDALDYVAKFSVPLVANGRVFIGSMSKLTAFGLLP